jgi:hypothetical protein
MGSETTKKGSEPMFSGYDIIPVRGHYEVYDADGNFVCSADTRSEALEELAA